MLITKKRDLDMTNDFSEQAYDVGACNICVRTCGDKSNPSILLLHGLQSHAGVWSKIAVDLASNGYYVVMPDRRGHGHSGHATSYHLFDYVSDLNAIAEEYCGDGFTLVGHCESCYLVTSLAGAIPDKIKRLILIQYPVPSRVAMDVSTKTDLIGSFLKKNMTFSDQVKFKSLKDAAERSRLGAPFPMPAEIAEFVAERNIKSDSAGGYTWRWDPKILNYRLLYNTHDLDIFVESIGRLTCDVIFVHGSQSSIIDTNKERIFSYTSNLNKNAKNKMVSGGHYPHLESTFKEVVNVILG